MKKLTNRPVLSPITRSRSTDVCFSVCLRYCGTQITLFSDEYFGISV